MTDTSGSAGRGVGSDAGAAGRVAATATATAAQFQQDDATAIELFKMSGAYVARGRKLGVRLDYSDESVAAAEEMGVQTYARLCDGLTLAELRELQSALVSELGAYVGETFIRNHGGYWG